MACDGRVSEVSVHADPTGRAQRRRRRQAAAAASTAAWAVVGTAAGAFVPAAAQHQHCVVEPLQRVGHRFHDPCSFPPDAEPAVCDGSCEASRGLDNSGGDDGSTSRSHDGTSGSGGSRGGGRALLPLPHEVEAAVRAAVMALNRSPEYGDGSSDGFSSDGFSSDGFSSDGAGDAAPGGAASEAGSGVGSGGDGGRSGGEAVDAAAPLFAGRGGAKKALWAALRGWAATQGGGAEVDVRAKLLTDARWVAGGPAGSSSPAPPAMCSPSSSLSSPSSPSSCSDAHASGAGAVPLAAASTLSSASWASAASVSAVAFEEMMTWTQASGGNSGGSGGSGGGGVGVGAGDGAAAGLLEGVRAVRGVSELQCYYLHGGRVHVKLDLVSPLCPEQPGVHRRVLLSAGPLPPNPPSHVNAENARSNNYPPPTPHPAIYRTGSNTSSLRLSFPLVTRAISSRGTNHTLRRCCTPTCGWGKPTRWPGSCGARCSRGADRAARWRCMTWTLT